MRVYFFKVMEKMNIVACLRYGILGIRNFIAYILI